MFEGFSNTAREAGVSLGDQAPWRSSEYANIDLLCAALIEKKITACFCNTDFLALKVIMKLQRIGVRVPEDISVMGRGNLSFCASSHPKITTLDENLFGIGKRATTLLLDIIEHGNTVIREEFFPHQLIIRDSTLSAFAEKGKVT